MRALLVGVVALMGCTAVYDDFEECGVELQVFEEPPCGMAYTECALACPTGDQMCFDRCAEMEPGCADCIDDTFLICAAEMGCGTLYTEAVCCFEGQCDITAGSCDECQAESEAVSTCWRDLVGDACNERVRDTCVAAVP